MHLLNTVIAVVASVTTVRAQAAALICTNINFSDCTDLGFHGDFVCSNLGSHFTDSISSFRINSGFACAFYDNTNCNDNQGVLDNQRGTVSDLRTVGFNDRIASYKCTVV